MPKRNPLRGTAERIQIIYDTEGGTICRETMLAVNIPMVKVFNQRVNIKHFGYLLNNYETGGGSGIVRPRKGV